MDGKLGIIFARAGHELMFSYSHNKEKLKRLVKNAQGATFWMYITQGNTILEDMFLPVSVIPKK